jgi:hypothetical protein
MWDMFGEIGGFYDFFRVVIGFTMAGFSQLRTKAILAE